MPNSAPKPEVWQSLRFSFFVFAQPASWPSKSSKRVINALLLTDVFMGPRTNTACLEGTCSLANNCGWVGQVCLLEEWDSLAS